MATYTVKVKDKYLINSDIVKRVYTLEEIVNELRESPICHLLEMEMFEYIKHYYDRHEEDGETVDRPEWHDLLTGGTHEYAILSSEYGCRSIDLSFEDEPIVLTESEPMLVSELNEEAYKCYAENSSFVDENEKVLVYNVVIKSTDETVTVYIPESWN